MALYSSKSHFIGAAKVPEVLKCQISISGLYFRGVKRIQNAKKLYFRGVKSILQLFRFFSSKSFAYFSHTPSGSSDSFTAGFLFNASTVPLMKPTNASTKVMTEMASATIGEMMIAIVNVKNLNKMFINGITETKCRTNRAKCNENASKCRKKHDPNIKTIKKEFYF